MLICLQIFLAVMVVAYTVSVFVDLLDRGVFGVVVSFFFLTWAFYLLLAFWNAKLAEVDPVEAVPASVVEVV